MRFVGHRCSWLPGKGMSTVSDCCCRVELMPIRPHFHIEWVSQHVSLFVLIFWRVCPWQINWFQTAIICHVWMDTHTHTQPFNGLWSGTTRVGRYLRKHSPTQTHPDHQTSFIIFLHLQRSMASTLFILRAWQSSCTTSLQVLFGLPLGLRPWTLYSIHFFTQSSSSFAAHAHTNAACSAAISMLCHLHLVSLSAPYLGVCLLA